MISAAVLAAIKAGAAKIGEKALAAKEAGGAAGVELDPNKTAYDYLESYGGSGFATTADRKAALQGMKS